jgi:hypothetical protein
VRVTIELPEGWAPSRKVISELHRLGYTFVEWAGAVRELELT